MRAPRWPRFRLTLGREFARAAFGGENAHRLKEGFHGATGWLHLGAGAFAFTTDVIQKHVPNCTLLLFLAAAVVLVVMLIVLHSQRAIGHVTATFTAFCLTTVLASAVVLTWQVLVGGEEDGAILTTLVRIERRVEKVQRSINENARQEQQHQADVSEKLAGLDVGVKAALEAINRDKGVPLPALLQILQRFGETTAANDPAEIERRLRQKADEYVALREEFAKLSGDDSRVQALRKEAQVALDASDFALARAKLQAASDIDAAAIDKIFDRAKTRALAAAASLEESARVAALTLHYRDAAGDHGKAAGLVARFDPHETWRLTLEQAGALSAQGDEFGDNDALIDAIGRYQAALQLASRPTSPAEWAMTQNNLGNALELLGERESGTMRLEEAVAAYHAALEERTRARVPLNWATTQNNLGNALATLGGARAERHGWRRRWRRIARRWRKGRALGCRSTGR